MTLSYRIKRRFLIYKELKAGKNLLTWFKKYPDDLTTHYQNAAASVDLDIVLDDPTCMFSKSEHIKSPGEEIRYFQPLGRYVYDTTNFRNITNAILTSLDEKEKEEIAKVNDLLYLKSVLQSLDVSQSIRIDFIRTIENRLSVMYQYEVLKAKQK
jgi:hypothetical protein